MEALVSIITAVYNAEKTIADTIYSVLQQDYQNLELIIVDDGSTDQSAEMIASIISNQKKIRLLRNTVNEGPAAARNLGLKEAGGKYITFIDSDDIWLKNFLSTTVDYMERNTLPFVFSSYRRISENGSKHYGDFIVPEKVDYDMLLKTNYISCLTAVYNAETVGKRYFNTSFPMFEDYIYWLAILKEGYVAHGQKQVLAVYRLRRGSVSRDKRGKTKYIWAIHKEIEGVPIYKRIYLIICYVYYGIRKNYRFMFLK